jgi:hypothetical protein
MRQILKVALGFSTLSGIVYLTRNHTINRDVVEFIDKMESIN